MAPDAKKRVEQKFHFTVGNDRVPLSLCGTVKAKTQREAVEIFREALDEAICDGLEIETSDKRVEYFRLYVETKHIKRTHQDFVED